MRRFALSGGFLLFVFTPQPREVAVCVVIDAISQAAKLLVEQLYPFVDYSLVSQMEVEKRIIRQAIPDEKYNMPVDQLDLSVRTMNCLRHAGITTVGELISKGEKELMAIRNFGQKSKTELEERLDELGLSFTPQTEEVAEEKVEEEKEVDTDQPSSEIT